VVDFVTTNYWLILLKDFQQFIKFIQCTYNVTFRSVNTTIVAVEKQ